VHVQRSDGDGAPVVAISSSAIIGPSTLALLVSLTKLRSCAALLAAQQLLVGAIPNGCAQIEAHITERRGGGVLHPLLHHVGRHPPRRVPTRSMAIERTCSAWLARSKSNGLVEDRGARLDPLAAHVRVEEHHVVIGHADAPFHGSIAEHCVPRRLRCRPGGPTGHSPTIDTSIVYTSEPIGGCDGR
jgi:hypothetical protein